MDFGVLDHVDHSNDAPLHEHYENRFKFIAALENAGFYGYHVTEHHGTPLGGACSPSVFLSSAAQRTSRIRLGTLVYSIAMHHPLRLAEEICMLDQLSGGRLDIGFGRGSVPFELSYFGIDPDEAREMYDEALPAVLAGIENGTIKQSGRYYKFDGVEVKLRPLQKPRPPMWYGVHSPQSAEKAASHGFNVVANQGTEASSKILPHFRKVWPELQGDAPLPKIGLHRAVYVAPTEKEAREIADRAYSAFLHSFRYVTRRHGAENKLSGRENDFAELMSVRKGIAGTPEQVAEYLAEDLTACQANYCLMYMMFGDLGLDEAMSSLDLFRTKVMPELQSLGIGEHALA